MAKKEKQIFGTDGIRGIANNWPMTPEVAVWVGKAVAHYFKNEKKKGKPKVVIGKDTRLSGYMLENALTSGCVSMGANVFLVGPMPTPAIAHLTRSMDADAGIVISASHNPAIDNGIKVFSADGYKLNGGQENAIERLVQTRGLRNEHIKGDMIGKAFRIEDAKGRYIEFCKSSVRSISLRGMKVVLDCAHGATYHIAPYIFSELGAEVVKLNVEPDGLNINKDCGALHPEVIQAAVRREKADIGIAFDGDGDRVIVCDEHGRIVDGDQILAISALRYKELGNLKNNTVVATVMSNIGFHKAMEREGINVATTKVGDKYVIEEMRKNGFILGGEQSGHIIFSKYSTTGDGIITALQICRTMKAKHRKLSQLASVMASYPQVLVNVKVKTKKPFEKIGGVKEKIDEIEGKLRGNGRLLLRYSGTEDLARVMIEGKSMKEIQRMANSLAALIRKGVGA